jgi:hypothetical protein
LPESGLARLLQKAIGREGDSTDGNDFEEIDLGFQTSRSRSRQAGGLVPCFRNSDCESSHDDFGTRFDRKSSRCCGQSACRCSPFGSNQRSSQRSPFGSARSRRQKPSDLGPVERPVSSRWEVIYQRALRDFGSAAQAERIAWAGVDQAIQRSRITQPRLKSKVKAEKGE